MGIKIGLDFGTTTSVLSYMDGPKPKCFDYGGSAGSGTEYIPSVVAYQPNDLFIGQDATDALPDEGSGYRYFKMLLPENDRANWPALYGAYATEPRTPAQVTADFIGELITGDSPSRRQLAPEFPNKEAFLRREREKIEGVVVSVPQVWSHWRALGRLQLKSVVRDLQLDLIQLISEPVAAAAYFAFKYQKNNDEPFYGNLLICDMGGGTFDVALCRLSENKVEVLCNAGNGEQGFGIAGAHFDHALLDQKFNSPPEPRVIAELLTNLDEQKKKERSYKLMMAGLRRPDEAQIKPIYTISAPRTLAGQAFNFTFADIQTAFGPVREGILEVLRKIQSEAASRNHEIEKVVMVGGFSRFPLVQQAIAEAFDEDIFEKRHRVDLDVFSRDEMAFAVSYGACLIANEKIQVAEKYEHTIGALIYNAAGASGDEEIELIKGGRTLDALEAPAYCAWPNGERRRFKISRDTITANIVIRRAGSLEDDQKTVHPCSLADVPGSGIADNYWYLGAQVDNSKIPYLVLQDEKLGEERLYSLGDLVPWRSEKNGTI